MIFIFTSFLALGTFQVTSGQNYQSSDLFRHGASCNSANNPVLKQLCLWHLYDKFNEKIAKQSNPNTLRDMKKEAKAFKVANLQPRHQQHNFNRYIDDGTYNGNRNGQSMVINRNGNQRTVIVPSKYAGGREYFIEYNGRIERPNRYSVDRNTYLQHSAQESPLIKTQALDRVVFTERPVDFGRNVFDSSTISTVKILEEEEGKKEDEIDKFVNEPSNDFDVNLIDIKSQNLDSAMDSIEEEKQVVPEEDKDVVQEENEAVIQEKDKEVITEKDQGMIQEIYEEVLPQLPETDEEVIQIKDEEVMPETDEEVMPETDKEVRPETDKEVMPKTDKEITPEKYEETIPEKHKEVMPEKDEETIPEKHEEVMPEKDEETIPEKDEEVMPEKDEEVIPVDYEKWMQNEYEDISWSDESEDSDDIQKKSNIKCPSSEKLNHPLYRRNNLPVNPVYVDKKNYPKFNKQNKRNNGNNGNNNDNNKRNKGTKQNQDFVDREYLVRVVRGKGLNYPEVQVYHKGQPMAFDQFQHEISYYL